MAFDTGVEGMTPPAWKGDVAARPINLNGAHARPGLARLAEAIDRNVFLVLVIAAAGLVRVGFLGLGTGSDTWYTLVGGRLVSGSWLPHADELTVLTRGREWVDEQWLAQLLLYGLWRAGSWQLALIVQLAAFLGAFVLAAVSALRLGASARSTAVIGAVSLLVAMGETGFRAQSLALPLFALLLLLLLDDEARPSRRVYLALPLLVLWANVHGSVLLGAALVTLRGLTVALEGNRRPGRTPWARAAALVVVPWLCTIASPYALALPGYYARLLHNPALSRFVTEWQPASVRNEPVFFVLLVGGALLVAWARRGSLFATLAFLATMVGGLIAVRHVIWFALTAAAVLPGALDVVWPSRPAPRRRRLNLAVAGVAVAALVVAVGVFAAHDSAWFERGYPARAGEAVAAAAAADPRAKVLANERFADWLLFEQPVLRGRVAYDVRFELLTQREVRRVAIFRLEQGADWPRLADSYRILVLDPGSEGGAISLFARERGARILFRDRDVAVIERGPR
jgi:hypothetical protein